jgi:pilus assembly protein Flp/PilA
MGFAEYQDLKLFRAGWANRVRRSNMRSLVKLITQIKSDENGAALIEYTVLLAILLIAVIAIIGGVGGWISTQWASLSTTI